MNYLQFRQKYPKFIYEKYSWEKKDNNLHLRFQYTISPDHKFDHQIIIDNFNFHPGLENIIFHIGLAEMFSYWKLTCSPQIEIQAGTLSLEQTSWWKKLLIGGMGEYFYKNQIDFTPQDFVQISSSGSKLENTNLDINNYVLVPLGGGKDSIVTLELLKNDFQVKVLMVNPTPAMLQISDISKITPLIIHRIIDPYLLDLNNQGYLNGHIPFSAALAFISLLPQYKYVALSNERSSNEGNVQYLGQIINHQYSKSLEFETNFNNYVHKYITSDINYFSFLRPLYELQISKLFSSLPQYFSIFKSCNVGQKTNSWCGHCPKCLSIALTLGAWIGEAKITQIMGINPLTDSSNAQILESMTNPSKVKPFECITTTEEANICLEFIKKGQTDKVSKFLTHWGPSHIPPQFEVILKSAYANS